MATNPRFEITSGSPDNAAYGYPNSHRSHYSTGSGGPSLERASSFRESHEGSGRGGTSGGAGPALPNAGNTITHGELPPLSHVLSLEQIATGDTKSSKQPELRKATAAALVLVGEGHGGFQPRPIEQLGPEELKRIRSSLLDNSSKAKERSRALLEAITKLDKFRASILSRKRARLEAHAHERPLSSVSGERPVPITSTQINPSKGSFCASPSHVSMGEGSMSKLEDKTKGLVPNKRVRTSMSDVRLEGRASMANFQRSSGLAERDRETIKSGGSLGGVSDEKDRLIPPGGEAWEKTKTKGKRSTPKSDCTTTMAASGVSEIDREHKWGGQHRGSIENRPRSTEGHSFRSGPVHGIMSIHKSAIRNEPDNAGPSGEKESRFILTDKERLTPTLKSGVKLPAHKDEGLLMSPTTVAKAKAARAPRSATGIPVIPTSSHAPRPPSNEIWERTAAGAPTRAQLPVGLSNRKRPAPTRSSSPPVTQWVGQRPQKMSRVARRMNIAPPMGPLGAGGTRDESIPTAEVASLREPTPTGARSNPSTSPIPGLVKRVASSSTAVLSQIKSKPDRVASPAGNSESDDSEGADVKYKEKWKKHADSEGRFAPVNQKMAPLFSPGKKSRVIPKEEGGDGTRRQGRSGRAIIAGRDLSNVTIIEKGDPSANAKQLRSARPGTDKLEKPVDVKPGRPPNKKGGIGDRKALTRPRRPAINTGGEVSGESDDDREELAAAVQAAVSASATACSSLFWKEIEPFFAYLTPDARNSLKIQVKARELEDEELLPSLTSDSKAEKNTPLDSTVAGRASYLSNGTMDVHGNVVSKVLNPKYNHALDGNKAGFSGGWPVVKELPLSQRLLAALIVEGDIENDSRDDRSQLELQGYVGDGSSHELSDSEQAGMEKDQDSESEVETRRGTLGKLNGRAKSSSYDVSYTSNGHRHWDSESELLNSPVKSELRKEEEKKCSDINGQNKCEGKYQSLTLDERIALELQSLGLYPDQGELPTREDDQIAEQLKGAQLELKELVHVNKERLSSLEKVVSNAVVVEERERERLAMIKLLENAFNKRLGTRGGHLGVSGSKHAASKAGRAAAVAIAKRSLARWKHYVDTKEACFNEAGLREILFCISSKEGEMANSGEMRLGINTVGLTLTGSSELKLAASDGTRWICPAFGTDKVDKDSCESDQIAVGTPSERTGDRDDVWSTRSKEREVLLEEVGGSGSAGSVLCGIKGKRSERERDAGTGKGSGGRQGIGAIKGERKTKTKPRQKTAPLLKAVNGLLGKPSDLPDKSNARAKHESGVAAQTEGEGAIDLSHLQIPGMDDLVGNGDLGGQGQDLGSWLDFDDPGLPDAGGDFMGLDVPMDDLADLSMIM